MSYYDSSWKTLLKKHTPWDDIIPLYYKSFPTEDGYQNKEELIQSFEDILEATGSWAKDVIAPRAREIDSIGAGELKDGRTFPSAPLLQTYKEATEYGVFGLCAGREFGGLGLPYIIGQLVFQQLNKACIGTGTQVSFFNSIADMIERFCDKETSMRLIPKIIAGEISGSMNLTEPGAGSDVGALKTTAEKQENGTYLLNGSKIFITNGGGGIGFVLARIKGAPEGLKGISLFLVEQDIPDKDEVNFRVTNIEDKLGMHASFTCEVLYENSIAHLVGEENQGLEYMFHLMNESRIGVGLQGLAGIEACLEYVREYAETRKQFGKNLLELPLYKHNLDQWEAEEAAIRCFMHSTFSWYAIYTALDLKDRHTSDLSEEEKKLFKKSKRIIRKRTPLVKFYGSEAYTRISTKAIQALGGYGFMKEYDVERFHRDSFAPLLYEGTSQIQSLMSMKDLLKSVSRNPAGYFNSLWKGHPIANMFNNENDSIHGIRKITYEFKKNLLFLLLKCLKPEVNKENLSEVKSFFNSKNWLKEENINKLMVHAETLCEAQSYIESARCVAEMDREDSSSNFDKVFTNYIKIIEPRLEGLYASWRV